MNTPRHPLRWCCIGIIVMFPASASAYLWQNEKRPFQVETSQVEETRPPKTDSTQRFKVRFHFFVRAPLIDVKRTILNYSIYKQVNPYLDKVEYHSRRGILELEGGIWKLKLGTMIKIEEKDPRLIHYTVLSGYSEGLRGELKLEPSRQPLGTWIRFEGDFRTSEKVPAFLVKRATNLLIQLTTSKAAEWVEK